MLPDPGVGLSLLSYKHARMFRLPCLDVETCCHTFMSVEHGLRTMFISCAGSHTAFDRIHTQCSNASSVLVAASVVRRVADTQTHIVKLLGHLGGFLAVSWTKVGLSSAFIGRVEVVLRSWCAVWDRRRG